MPLLRQTVPTGVKCHCCMNCHAKVIAAGTANRNKEVLLSFLCSHHSSASWRNLTGSQLATKSGKYTLLYLSPRLVRQIYEGGIEIRQGRHSGRLVREIICSNNNFSTFKLYHIKVDHVVNTLGWSKFQ